MRLSYVPSFVSDLTAWLALVTATGAALAVLWRPLRTGLKHLIRDEIKPLEDQIEKVALDLKLHMHQEESDASDIRAMLAEIARLANGSHRQVP